MKLGIVDPIRNIEDLETVSFFCWHFFRSNKSKPGPLVGGQFYHAEMHKCKEKMCPPDLTSDYGPNYCTPLVIETFLNVSDFNKN